MTDSLDLAFAVDCTGSMSSYINQAKQNIINIVNRIRKSGTQEVRLALVRYRDHPPQDTSYVTNVMDFSNVTEMKRELDNTNAGGGGDTPEAVADALNAVKKLRWKRDAAKICVIIADAPPHGLATVCTDAFPNGCPDGHDPMKIANDLAEIGVSIHVVGCEPSICQWEDFFMSLSKMSGGLYIPLQNASHLADAIVGAAQEEVSLSGIRSEIENILENEMKRKGVDEEMVAAIVWDRLKGRKTKHLNINGNALPKVSARAKRFARFDNLPDVKKKFQVSTETRPTPMGSVFFTVEETELDMPQVQRMLQKVMMMKGIH